MTVMNSSVGSTTSAGPTTEVVTREIASWLTTWQHYINTCDTTGARPLFRADVVGFGTKEEQLIGLDRLEAEQWAKTWDRIHDFTFDLQRLHVIHTGDARLAAAVLPFSSTGLDADGARFHRPGRSTIVLCRDDTDSAWRAIHTHFSLVPGTPNTYLGPR